MSTARKTAITIRNQYSFLKFRKTFSVRNELSERPTWVHINFSKIEMMKIFYFRYNFLNGKLILNHLAKVAK